MSLKLKADLVIPSASEKQQQATISSKQNGISLRGCGDGTRAA
jgi:hypothetical protein